MRHQADRITHREVKTVERICGESDTMFAARVETVAARFQSGVLANRPGHHSRTVIRFPADYGCAEIEVGLFDG